MDFFKNELLVFFSFNGPIPFWPFLCPSLSRNGFFAYFSTMYALLLSTYYTTTFREQSTESTFRALFAESSKLS